MFELRPYNRNSLSAWNPFAEMEQLQKRFFDGSLFSTGFAGFKTDIVDEGDHYELKADLPGFKKEDIHLDLENDLLTISAERRAEHEEQDQEQKFVRCERSYGSYRRSFSMEGVDQDKISAKYADGVLSLTLPKVPEVQPAVKRLEIE